MKILDIQCIIPNLLPIRRLKALSTSLELQTKNRTLYKKHYIDTFTKSRYGVLEKHMSIVIFKD